MKKGVVVVDDTETHRTLLETAGEHAAGADAELVLFSPVTEAEFAAKNETFQGTSGEAVYGVSTARETAAQRARKLATDALADVDVEYQIAPSIVDEKRLASAILDVANTHDCDHIFLVGKSRSPTGKAVFGDVAQSVILAFDGQVTVEVE